MKNDEGNLPSFQTEHIVPTEIFPKLLDILSQAFLTCLLLTAHPPTRLYERGAEQVCFTVHFTFLFLVFNYRCFPPEESAFYHRRGGGNNASFSFRTNSLDSTTGEVVETMHPFHLGQTV